jgi:hypothetical protein
MPCGTNIELKKAVCALKPISLRSSIYAHRVLYMSRLPSPSSRLIVDT